MGSRRMDFPSPRGAHVPESYYASLDPDDPYRRPPSHRNRYSRSVHQTPRIRDVAWISSPDPVTPQTPQAPPSPWLGPPHAPSTPARRPPSPIPPSPVPTVGERMTLDEFAFVQDIEDPYRRPQRPGLIKSFWKGLKKLSGLQPSLPFPIPRPGSYESQMVGVPVPVLSALSEATQYVNPTPPETSGTTRTTTRTTGTEEHRSTTPYTSPYVRPASVGASPGVIPSSLRASPAPFPSMDIPPPITVISPSDPTSSIPNSTRSIRIPLPVPVQHNLSVGPPEPMGSAEDGSQTLHEPVIPHPVLPPLISAPVPVLAPVLRIADPKLMPANGGAVVRSHSLSPTMARFRRFVANLDGLPWISDAQIADEYIPEKNSRSRLRAKVRQGAEPSWYNPRPEVAERPAYWSEWDMWAKQSTAAMWDGTVSARVGWAGVGAGGGLGQGREQWGMPHPHGYTPVQPGLVYPSGYPPPGVVNGQDHAPVLS